MTLTRKFMVDTLTVWYGLEQLAEMTDREVYKLYCERMGHDDTQESCKERFCVALYILTQTLEGIDEDTPEGGAPPNWWIKMVSFEREAKALHHEFTK